MTDIPKIAANSSLETVIQDINVLIDEYNFLSKYFSLRANLSADIVTVEFEAGETKTVPHKLGKVPGGRIILKQEGNGVLSDIPSGWNNTSIKMINNGAEIVTATLLIVRE